MRSWRRLRYWSRISRRHRDRVHAQATSVQPPDLLKVIPLVRCNCRLRSRTPEHRAPPPGSWCPRRRRWAPGRSPSGGRIGHREGCGAGGAVVAASVAVTVIVCTPGQPGFRPPDSGSSDPVGFSAANCRLRSRAAQNPAPEPWLAWACTRSRSPRPMRGRLTAPPAATTFTVTDATAPTVICPAPTAPARTSHCLAACPMFWRRERNTTVAGGTNDHFEARVPGGWNAGWPGVAHITVTATDAATNSAPLRTTFTVTDATAPTE